MIDLLINLVRMVEMNNLLFWYAMIQIEHIHNNVIWVGGKLNS